MIPGLQTGVKLCHLAGSNENVFELTKKMGFYIDKESARSGGEVIALEGTNRLGYPLDTDLTVLD